MYNGCNQSENYEKIKRRIEEERKKYKYCYIKGPTVRCNKSSIYFFKW